MVLIHGGRCIQCARSTVDITPRVIGQRHHSEWGGLDVIDTGKPLASMERGILIHVKTVGICADLQIPNSNTNTSFDI